MPLDAILTSIRAEADEEIRRTDEDAARQAGAILVEMQRRAAAEEERLAGSRDELIRLAEARLVNHARLEAERRLRAAREELFQAAVEETRRRLDRVRERVDYPELLGRLLDEALAVMPAAREVRVDPRDLPLIERLLGAREAEWRVETSLRCRGGLDLATDDGRRVANTLDGRLERAAGELRRLAAEVVPDLAGGGP